MNIFCLISTQLICYTEYLVVVECFQDKMQDWRIMQVAFYRWSVIFSHLVFQIYNIYAYLYLQCILPRNLFYFLSLHVCVCMLVDSLYSLYCSRIFTLLHSIHTCPFHSYPIYIVQQEELFVVSLTLIK